MEVTMNFWDGLSDHGDRPALTTENASISYVELAARADAFCADLRTRLPATVTRPLILLETANQPDAVIAYLGAVRAGWPVILLADGAGGRDSQIVKTYLPNVVVRRGGNGWQVDLVSLDAIDMHPDLAVLLSTSGTTGAAKLVRLSRQNLAANAESIAAYLGVRPDDRALTVLPFHYSYGMSVLHIHLRAGAALVLTDGSVIDPDLRALARRSGVTSLALVPTQFELLDDLGWLPDLRYITQAGGRIDPVLARRFAAKAQAEGWQLFIMYGQTEAAPRMSYVPPQDAQDWFHTIGRPIPGGAFRLIDAAGAEIAATGVTGKLVYEGPNVMLGYAVTRDDLAAPAGPAILHTGDMAERLENGYFCITGRASRFIKLFGLRIGLDEVETQLRADGIRAYVSGTDARLVVFVRGQTDMKALQTQVTARFQLPQSAVLVARLEAVPLLPSGKVDYRLLAQRAAGMKPVPLADPGTEALLRQVLRIAVVDPERSFLNHGGDSLAYLEMQLHLTSVLGEVPARWEELPLRDLLGLRRRQLPGGQASVSALQVVPADLLARVSAVLAVIALHSTTWPTGGGAYLLFILTGFSLARFQSGVLFAGDVLRTWRSMLIPILTCYYLLIGLIALTWAPVGIEWFFLLGNFQTDIQVKGLIPYWFVSAYVQVIVGITLVFVVPALRRQIAHAPFAAGFAALTVIVLAIPVFGIADLEPQIRHRHPLAAAELVLLGWCVFFARTMRNKVIMTAVALIVWGLTWRDAGLSVTLLMLLGTGAVIWGLGLPIPRRAARAVMQVGSLTLFLYLVHVPVIAVLARVLPGPDPLRFSAVMGASLIAAYALKVVYDWLVAGFGLGLAGQRHSSGHLG